jgi:bifunctional DNase/RNase
MQRQDSVAGERELVVVSVTQINDELRQVLLREKSGNRICALHCDLWSAIGIDQKLEGRTPHQLNVQELVRRVMQETGTQLVRILLFGGEDHYVWARLFLRQNEREFTIDCRAADGVAQALRWKLPIMMDEVLLRDSHRTAQGIPDGLGPPAGNA